MLRSLLAAALLLAPLPLAAEDLPCGNYALGAAVLAQRYGEHLAWAGRVDGERALGLFTARDGSTWTLLEIRRDGVACLLLYGRGSRFDAAPSDAH